MFDTDWIWQSDEATYAGVKIRQYTGTENVLHKCILLTGSQYGKSSMPVKKAGNQLVCIILKIDCCVGKGDK